MDTRRHYKQVSMKRRVIMVTMLWIGWSVECKPHLQSQVYGRRERLWRCTGERNLARMHRATRLVPTTSTKYSRSKQHRVQQRQHKSAISFADRTSFQARLHHRCSTGALQWPTAVCPEAPVAGMILATITSISRLILDLLCSSTPDLSRSCYV